VSVQAAAAKVPTAPVDLDITITDIATGQGANARDHFVPPNH
jgi:hypothetical protein